MTMNAFSSSLMGLVLLSVSACSGNDTRYATPPVEPSARISSRYQSLEVVEVTLPSYAADQAIFVQSADGAISELGGLWADDPARALTLQLARDLTNITGATVAPAPWPFRSYAAAKVDVRLEEMLATASGTFRIAGQYFVAPEDDGREPSGQFSIAVPLPENATPAQIAAARGAASLALAEEIARKALR
ncbi:membrane integrity-associated transporter subunit PqiC [Puniceibacterium sp. IMCC21224]|uniref:PqiC family protein n=1 Tax=Puniceibacterium sp. IMCC21224 TaxID=1618204 RepID=UPI00065D1F96|nr:ABC-type transport auxiliary lipoprotein family protein [Puniceibacterium sp. IMCC21224]KMK66789.1 Protein of unknown function (DUF330) [Puniceibacterium sp. IMCC21224]